MFVFKIFSLLFCINFVSATCGPEETMTNEKKILCCYYDSLDIPTIGYGFNLQRSDANNVMSRYGLTLVDVLQNCGDEYSESCLSDNDADDIFNTISYPEAASCADNYASNLPPTVRAAVIDVAFAGCGTLNKFKKMQEALQNQDWQTAGDELVASRWCEQVKGRCDRDYNCIVGGV